MSKINLSKEKAMREFLAKAGTIQEARYCVRRLIWGARYLPEALQSELLAAAGAVQDERCRAWALSGISEFLPEVSLSELLTAVRAIQNEGSRAEALREIAWYLPEALQSELLAAACAIQDEGYRALALGGIAARVPDELKPDLLAEVLAIQDEELRAQSLSEIALLLPEASQPELLAVARHRSQALSGIAGGLPEVLQPGLFAAARMIQDEEHGAKALGEAAWRLPKALQPDLLAAARAIQDEEHRARALSGVVRHLPKGLKPDLLAAARAIQDEEFRVQALSGVAWYLPDELKPDLLAAALAIQDEEIRAQALSGVASCLPDELKPDLLAAALAIQDEEIRAQALSRVARHLPDELHPDLLSALRAIRDHELRIRTQREIVQHLWVASLGPMAGGGGGGAITEAFVHIKILERYDQMLAMPARRLELWEGVVTDRSYEVRIDVSEHRDPRQQGGPKEPPLRRPGGQIITLRVAVVTNSHTLHFTNQVSSFVWGPGSTTQAAVFHLHAQSAGSGSFDVFIDYDCDLLFAARVKLDIADEEGAWTSRSPIIWEDATTEKVRGAKRSMAFQRFSALMQRRPGERALCIAVTRGAQPDEYILTVLRRQAELPMRVNFSRAALDGLLMTVRGTLDLQRRESVLLDGGYDATGMYVGNYGPDAGCWRVNGTAVSAMRVKESWDLFLSRMATHGRALCDTLFADAASQEVLTAIRNGTPVGSVLQVWTHNSAKEFLLPWAWIYDGDYRPGTRETPKPEEFWGQRLIIEQIVDLPSPYTAAGPTIATGNGLKIHAGVYNFEQLPAHRKFLESLGGKASSEGGAGAVSVEIDDRADDFVRFLRRCDADLLYFFCHGHAARPPSVASDAFYDMVEELRRWLDAADNTQNDTVADAAAMQDTKLRLRSALNELLSSGLITHDHIRLTVGCLMAADLRKLTLVGPHTPLVMLNMCESAQVFPSLSDGLVRVFLSQGAVGVIGTEMPMLPQFADLFGRKLLNALLQGTPVGQAILMLRRQFMSQRNPLGLAYTHFGDALVRFVPSGAAEHYVGNREKSHGQNI